MIRLWFVLGMNIAGSAMIVASYAACHADAADNAVHVFGSGGGGSGGSSEGGVPQRCNPVCCTDDGACCDCVSACAPPFTEETFPPDQVQAVNVLNDCLCSPNVCGSVCSTACAGGAFRAGDACDACLNAAVLGACKAVYPAWCTCAGDPNCLGAHNHDAGSAD